MIISDFYKKINSYQTLLYIPLGMLIIFFNDEYSY